MNCFKTHNKLTMYPLGKSPLAPSDNTAMRWKCSLATEEERQKVEEWIATSVLGKEEEILKPWKAEEGDDEQLVENEFIQRCTFHFLSKVLSQTNEITQIYGRPPRHDRCCP